MRLLASRQPAGTAVIAVVKAGGYGHGARPVARAALEAGAVSIAVSTLEEAAEVLDLCPAENVLALGGLTPKDAAAAAALGCAVMCHRLEMVRALDAAAGERGVRLAVHLKVDTGMGRLGCRPEEAADLARAITTSRWLRLAGTYTHFASSDTDELFTRQQHERFLYALESMTQAGIDPGLRHASNSGSALRFPDLALDAVRVGIALYGCEDPALRPGLALRALVTQVKTLRPGETVGYGSTWRAQEPTRVATVSLGYADGVHRARGNRGHALIRGRPAPLIGRVSMDATTFDANGIDGVEAGDAVTFIGRDGDAEIRAEVVAEWSGTISYEVLTAIGPRVERRYRE